MTAFVKPKVSIDTRGNFILEDVTLVFKNFTGKVERFNSEGRRKFSILLDSETAQYFRLHGMNVRALQLRDGQYEDEQRYVMDVRINMNSQHPPRINIVSSTTGVATPLAESSLEILDWADIVRVDCIVNPYKSLVGGKNYVTAYLSSLYATINENPLEQKYSRRE